MMKVVLVIAGLRNHKTLYLVFIQYTHILNKYVTVLAPVDLLFYSIK